MLGDVERRRGLSERRGGAGQQQRERHQRFVVYHGDPQQEGIRHANLLAAIITIASFTTVPSFAQAPGQYPPAELDRLVSRIALYPDPLLAQILAASTFPEQIPDVSHGPDDHHYLSGEPLARAIADDHLPMDPSVQALLPFPSVLHMMAADMPWTQPASATPSWISRRT